MSTYQKIIIVGNLGGDPVVRRFDNGGIVAQFSVATTEHWTDKTTNEKKSLTEWHNVVVRGKQAELCEKYLKKGDKVCIDGKMRTRKWTDTNNVERYVTELNAENLTFMTPKSTTTSPPNTGSAVDDYEAKQKATTGTSNEDDEPDLPF
jgi:single-strand DNA-binding protein